jgi:hypothetical protein
MLWPVAWASTCDQNNHDCATSCMPTSDDRSIVRMTATVRPNIKRDLPHGRERPWLDVGKCGVTIYEYELTFVIFAVEGNSAIAPAPRR